MDKELQCLKDLGTWKVVPRPRNRNVISVRWVFDVKTNADGSVERLKARLVARGFSQEPGIDYKFSYAPVVRLESVRLFLTAGIKLHMDIRMYDFSSAYLNSVLKEELYCELPPEYVQELAGPDATSQTHVCLLQKALYGLVQAGHCWNKTFDSKVKKTKGVRQLKSDPCVYVIDDPSSPIGVSMLLLYVDDVLTIGNGFAATMARLSKLFRLRDLDFPQQFLGLAITRIPDGVLISQRKYVEKVLHNFSMLDSNPAPTPMAAGTKLTTDMCPTTPSDIQDMSRIPYREVVGCLRYLVTASRPDIAYAVKELSRFLQNPGHQHWQAAKRVLRYLNGTRDLGIHIPSPPRPRRSPTLELVTFCDADLAGETDTRKSTTGIVIFLDKSPVLWKSKQQKTVSTSTQAAELTAVATATEDTLWLRNLLAESGLTQSGPTTIHEDNSAAALWANGQQLGRARYLAIRFAFIREQVQLGAISVARISTSDQRADALTKNLGTVLFRRALLHLGLLDACSLPCSSPGNTSRGGVSE